MTESMERARVSRRSFLGGIGVTAGGLMVASGPVLWQQAAKADTVTAEQVHLTFGEDPAREVVVSWVTPTSVSQPEGDRRHHRGRLRPDRSRPRPAPTPTPTTAS